MRKIILVMFLLLTAYLSAQDMSVFANLRHSSRDAQGNLHIRFNGVDETFTDYQLFYSTGGEWTAVSPELTGNLEYEAEIPYNWGQSLDYRVKTSMTMEGESMSYLQGAYLPETTFPPALNRLALIGSDPAGDSLTVYAPALDLTDTYLGYNDTKLVRGLRNSANAFPTLNSITSYNLYMSMIANPEAASDSVAFAMIYSFNILGVVSTGLYKIGMGESEIPTFSRLGNIQSQVSGGTLFMACNWADLAADPDFGGWPNTSSTLLLTDVTMQLVMDIQTMTPTFNLGDYGTIGVAEFIRHHYQVTQNTLPEVEWTSHSEATGQYLVTYTDADGDCPLVAKLQLDDTGMNFVDLVPETMDIAQGTYTFAGILPIPTGYYFQFSDNAYDLVVLEEYVDSDDPVIPVSQVLGCRMQNPVSSGIGSVPITLSGLSREALRISVFNMRGQEVQSLPQITPRNETETLNWTMGTALRNAPTGIYFLRISQGSRIITHKVMVIK
ncbi:MAG TPA: T9SS type A sorting domain-containing protein [Candidatus Cloacimonadota bacterium]|nr:T9SS type A sorting domain-containing protein [Candidatus Cloacimonadota bacterium]HPS39260.1 T9SS type A sorting domain-containing protein [Candidatus Cloacimonadota bacterium]